MNNGYLSQSRLGNCHRSLLCAVAAFSFQVVSSWSSNISQSLEGNLIHAWGEEAPRHFGSFPGLSEFGFPDHSLCDLDGDADSKQRCTHLIYSSFRVLKACLLTFLFSGWYFLWRTVISHCFPTHSFILPFKRSLLRIKGDNLAPLRGVFVRQQPLNLM